MSGTGHYQSSPRFRRRGSGFNGRALALGPFDSFCKVKMLQWGLTLQFLKVCLLRVASNLLHSGFSQQACFPPPPPMLKSVEDSPVFFQASNKGLLFGQGRTPTPPLHVAACPLMGLAMSHERNSEGAPKVPKSQPRENAVPRKLQIGTWVIFTGQNALVFP